MEAVFPVAMRGGRTSGPFEAVHVCGDASRDRGELQDNLSVRAVYSYLVKTVLC